MREMGKCLNKQSSDSLTFSRLLLLIFFLSVLAQNRFLLENREQSECVVSVDSVVCH